MTVSSGRQRASTNRIAIPTIVGVALLVVLVGCSSSSPGPTASATASLAPPPTTVSPKLLQRASDADLGDVTAVSLPAPVDGDTTAVWLRGDGEAAEKVLDAAAGLWRDGSAACPSVAADLDAAGSPAEVRAAATGVPDEPTRELLVDLQASVAGALKACADPSEFDRQAAIVAWQWALADRRLTQLGAR